MKARAACCSVGRSDGRIERPVGYFFGRLGTAGGARPVETPGREGTKQSVISDSF